MCNLYSSARSQDEIRRTFAVDLDPVGDGVDPEVDGTRLARQQRAVTMAMPGAAEPVCLVGGAVELVTIRQHEIPSRVVKRWADRVGERISPLATHAVAT